MDNNGDSFPKSDSFTNSCIKPNIVQVFFVCHFVPDASALMASRATACAALPRIDPHPHPTQHVTHKLRLSNLVRLHQVVTHTPTPGTSSAYFSFKVIPTSYLAIPTPMAASVTRSISRLRIMHNIAPFSSPTRFWRPTCWAEKGASHRRRNTHKLKTEAHGRFAARKTLWRELCWDRCNANVRFRSPP